MIRRAAASIIFLIGCGGSRSDLDSEIVLRVSAVAGLSDLVPGLDASGASPAAMELVYDAADQHIEWMRAEGSSVILVRRAESRFSSRQLAASLRSQELVSATALDGQRIAAQFRDDKTATLVVQYSALGFDLGPFQVDAQDERHVRLLPRGDSHVDAIEIIESTRADEWRKLLGHEFDVIPWAANLYRRQFSGIGSIRVLDIPPVSTAALYFNVRAEALADARVRRGIASAINRKAIAQLACGTANCASPAVTRQDDTALPATLDLLVPEDDTTLLTAAKILRHQLWRLDTKVEIKPVPVSDLVRKATAGEFDLALAPLSLADHRFGFFLSPGHPKALPVTGFTNAEYDAAVDRGDLATAQQILDRELPVTRLFEVRTFAAIDAGFCGDVTPSDTSWRWLSELYPCEEAAR